MTTFQENSIFEVLACGNNFSYIFREPQLFSMMDYKILQSNSNSPFVRCMKMLYNGKIQILYLTEGLRPFNEILAQLDSESFLTVTANIIRSVCAVKENGFLKCINIDLETDHIYIDPTTYKAFLLYVPATTGFYTSEIIFENELRSGIAKLIIGQPGLSTPKTMQLFSNLQNMSLPLENVFSGIIQGKTLRQTDSSEKIREVKLISINMQEKTEIIVDKDKYVLGRSSKTKTADGIIYGSRMVGRAHCCIIRSSTGCAVKDLMSSNGTFVNNKRVPSGSEITLKDGDILRLANVELKVLIK